VMFDPTDCVKAPIENQLSFDGFRRSFLKASGLRGSMSF
jgi:hypothetical protein